MTFESTSTAMSSLANSAGHETGRGPDSPEQGSGARPAWIDN